MKSYIYLFSIFIFVSCRNSPNLTEKKTFKQKGDSINLINGTVSKTSDIEQYIICTATLSAFQKGEITSETSSTVSQLNVRNGEHVETGDTLIILDPQPAQFELEKSRGDFIKATNEFISELKLSNSKKVSGWEEYLNSISRSDVIPPLPNSLSKSKMMSIVRYNLHTHYNQVKQSEKWVQNCVIKAPFSGLVSDIKVFPGIHVNQGTVLFTLMDISKMNVEIDVLESDLSFIHIGTPFEFVEETHRRHQISAIHPRINPDTRSGVATEEPVISRISHMSPIWYTASPAADMVWANQRQRMLRRVMEFIRVKFAIGE